MAFHPSTGGIGALGALNKASVSGVGEPMSTDALIVKLVDMTPAERQQFASINANDPLKLSAAKYVDNQLKTQASQLVAQQNRMAPPPVNQQAVASMAGAPQQPAPQQMAQGLPEETGIGALPVPAMKHMATGGIVAFGEGGLNDALAAVDASMPDPRVDPSGFNRFGGSMTDYLNARQKAIQAVKYNLTPENPESLQAYESTYGANYRSGPELRKAEPSKGVPYIGSGVPSASAAALRGGASTQASQKERADAAPRVDTGAAPRAGARAGSSTVSSQAAMPNAAATYADMMKQLPPTVVPQEYRDIEQLQVEQANKGLESDQAAAAKLQEYLGKRGERLDQRASRLKDKSDNDINMSLIDAGLAMMQSRGQGLAGIAEGASVGMKRYTDELRQNEAARQKIEEARDAYDDLKFNREDMSRKEILARKKEISDAHVALKKNNVDYMVSHEGMDRKTADHMYDSAMNFALEGQRQQFQGGENALNRANALQAAGITSGAGLKNQLGILEALGGAKPDSAIAKGFKLQKLEAQEPAMFKNYIDLSSDPIKGDKFKAQYPDFSSYLADFNKRGGIAALQGSAGAAPVVLPR
jgi:hypothetical protein